MTEQASHETEQRSTVRCDEGCGALLEPRTLDEYKAALKHHEEHGYNGGCSHGC